MIDQLIEYDSAALRYLNGLHAPWLDPIMLFLTQRIIWLPLYLFLSYLVIKEYKKESWIILLGIGLTVLLADQVTSSIMKPYFARFRPSHEPSLEGLVHIVEGYKGGKFGFASSHAANTFGAATFFFLLFRNTKKLIIWLFVWAALVSYTRIYLGVHYPGDILVGALVGVIAGLAGYKLSSWLGDWYDRKKTPAPG